MFNNRLPNQFDDPNKMFKNRPFYKFSYELIESVNKDYRDLSFKHDVEDQKSWINAKKLHCKI